MEYQVSPDLVFSGRDLDRPRMVAEAEKLKRHFPCFRLYGSDGRVTSVRGDIRTSYGGVYAIRVELGEQYPYTIPRVFVGPPPLEDSPHQYKGGNICFMRSEQWSSVMSLAFAVTRAAIWLNKYDSWRRNGRRRWPGKGQEH